MLVPAMNIEEIRKELNKDFPVLNRKMVYVAHKLLKTIKPARDKIITRVSDYFSGNKNKWLYRLSISQKKQECFLLIYYYNAKGISAFSKINNTDYLLHFTSHFFDRYNERCHLGLKDKIEIMKVYLSENGIYTFHERQQIANGIFKIYSLTQKGIILGTLDKNLKVYHFNTFIPLNLLSKKKFRVVSESIQEIITQLTNGTIQVGKQMPVMGRMTG
jgi:hypothetical protein